jgi:hypothetical protein
LGLVIRNIGTQFTTYSEVREKLPLEVIVGVSQELEHVPLRWHLIREFATMECCFSNPLEELSLDGTSAEEKISFVNTACDMLFLVSNFS